MPSDICHYDFSEKDRICEVLHHTLRQAAELAGKADFERSQKRTRAVAELDKRIRNQTTKQQEENRLNPSTNPARQARSAMMMQAAKASDCPASTPTAAPPTQPLAKPALSQSLQSARSRRNQEIMRSVLAPSGTATSLLPPPLMAIPTEAPPSTAAPLLQAQAPVFPPPSAAETDPEKIQKRCDRIIADLRLVRAMPSRPDALGGWGCVIPVMHRAAPKTTFALKISKDRAELAEGNTEKGLHCDKSQILREYRALQLCTMLPHVVQLAKVPGFRTGLASRKAGGESEEEIVGLFMDWIPSIQLQDAFKLPQWKQQVLTCIHALVSGVVAIHDRLLLHTDIKLNNLLIHDDLSSVTIVDLGNSVTAEEGFANYGTAGYRAPELASGFRVRREGDARCLEAWAVGVTALQLVSGSLHLVEKVGEEDKHDRAERQDAALARLAREGSRHWPKALAHEKGGQAVIDNEELFAFIRNTLSILPQERERALRAYVCE